MPKLRASVPTIRASRIAIAVAFACILYARPASASCSVDNQGPCYRYWHTDAVFVGEVSEKTLIQNELLGGTYRLQVAILEAFRGTGAAGSSIIVNATDGECGVDARVGQKMFFYADRNKDGELFASMYSVPFESANENLDYARSAVAHRASAMLYGEVIEFDEPAGDVSSFKAMRGVLVRVRGNRFTAQARTDSDGRYSIRLPGAGKYTVETIAPDGFALRSPGPTRVRLKDPQECFKDEVHFIRNGRIRGAIVDSKGGPISNLALEVVGAHGPAKTDHRGRFDIGPLSRGDYIVRAVTGGDGVDIRSGLVKVLEGQSTVLTPLVATVTHELTTLTVDTAGLAADAGWIEVFSEGAEMGQPVAIGSQTKLTFVVEVGASFEIVVSTESGTQRVPIKVQTPATRIRLSQLLSRPPQ